MTLQETLRAFGGALQKVVPTTYHGFRPRLQAPFLLWQEQGEDGSLSVDNQKVAQTIAVSVDYFSKDGLDVKVDALQAAFRNLCRGWRFSSKQYEDDTGLHHWEWYCYLVVEG